MGGECAPPDERRAHTRRASRCTRCPGPSPGSRTPPLTWRGWRVSSTSSSAPPTPPSSTYAPRCEHQRHRLPSPPAVVVGVTNLTGCWPLYPLLPSLVPCWQLKQAVCERRDALLACDGDFSSVHGILQRPWAALPAERMVRVRRGRHSAPHARARHRSLAFCRVPQRAQRWLEAVPPQRLRQQAERQQLVFPPTCVPASLRCGGGALTPPPRTGGAQGRAPGAGRSSACRACCRRPFAQGRVAGARNGAECGSPPSR